MLCSSPCASSFSRHCRPSNILLGTTGEALLSDFGLSRFASNGERPWVGSRPYVAPEILLRPSSSAADVSSAAPVTAKADVWSAGVVTYEALTGSRRGVSADDVVSVGPSWSLPELPADVEGAAAFVAVLRLMLTVDPEVRPDCYTLLLHPAVVPLRLMAGSAMELGDAGASTAAPAPAPYPPHVVSGSRVPLPPPSPLTGLVAGSPLRLPAPPEGFVGRRADLERLRAFDPSGRGGGDVVLSGLRGMGGSESHGRAELS